MSKFSMDDYIDVAERIVHFKEQYPDGTLQTVNWTVQPVGERTFIVYQAAAYRTPDDPRPGMGIAWEPFPGPTPYTRDSELMNAETAAWGRAIVACGLAANRKIASRQEVKARQAPAPAPAPKPGLSEDTLKAVVSAIRAAAMPTDWLRLNLVSLGVENVPEGEIRPSTLRALTPAQAEGLLAVCGRAVEDREKAA